jgi:hypothetical protein
MIVLEYALGVLSKILVEYVMEMAPNVLGHAVTQALATTSLEALRLKGVDTRMALTGLIVLVIVKQDMIAMDNVGDLHNPISVVYVVEMDRAVVSRLKRLNVIPHNIAVSCSRKRTSSTKTWRSWKNFCNRVVESQHQRLIRHQMIIQPP